MWLLPVRAWAQVGPMSTPRRHSPSRRQRWSVSGSLIPASSSSFPAVPAPSARHAPLAHTCSAHRSSCGDKDSFRLRPLRLFTDLQQKLKKIKCQILQEIYVDSSSDALGSEGANHRTKTWTLYQISSASFLENTLINTDLLAVMEYNIHYYVFSIWQLKQRSVVFSLH